MKEYTYTLVCIMGFQAEQLFAAMSVALQEVYDPQDARKVLADSNAITDSMILRKENDLPSLLQADPGSFYGDVRYFHHEASRPQPARCSCFAMCKGAKAMFKCYSCLKFDPEGSGYYCDACFEERHPWHRAAHAFATIDEAADTEAELARQVYRTEVDESVRFLEDMVYQIRDWSVALRPTLEEGTERERWLKEARESARRVELQLTDMIDLVRSEGVTVDSYAINEVAAEACRVQRAYDLDSQRGGKEKSSRWLSRQNGTDPGSKESRHAAARSIQRWWKHF